MAKLYVFGIGGTGARTIKSLTMLLAAGVESNYEIIPILIDPDKSAADVNRTKKILNDYKIIQEKSNQSKKSLFFKNKIGTLGNVVNTKHGNTMDNDNFVMNIPGIEGGRFKDFIDYSNLDPTNQVLTDLLFSKDNLDLDLEVGFKGNPNIGSVVLNGFTNSQFYQYFADVFEPDDRIFIISSIFGGTGSAGFPLLLKNLRTGMIGGKHYNHIKNAVIGAITVQPYFKLETDSSSVIDSHGFNAKAKAALHYYHNNITGNKSINALYYIGDNGDNLYKNKEGGTEQKNDAHFIELASALSIIDFAHNQDLQTTDGIAVEPSYLEFGIKNNLSTISFKDLSDKTNFLIKESLTRFFYFNIFCKDKLRDNLDKPFASDGAHKIDQNFLNQPYYYTLSDFFKSFRIWLGELQRNNISFSPFLVEFKTDSSGINVEDIKDINSTNIFALVNGVEEKKTSLLKMFSDKNYDFFINELNKAHKKSNDSYTSIESRLIELFSEGTEQILKQKLF